MPKSMDYGLLFVYIAVICLAVTLILALPAYIAGTAISVRQGGWRVLRRSQRLLLPGATELDTDMVRKTACQALTRWKRLWSATWPRFLYSQFSAIPEPNVCCNGHNHFFIRFGDYGTYALRVLVREKSHYYLEIRRTDLRYRYIAAPVLGLGIGMATGSVFTIALAAAVLITSQLGDPTGRGWYIASEVAANAREGTH